MSSPAAGYLPKPLKGPPRQSFAPLARTAAGRACACSIQLGTPKGSTGLAVTRRRVSAETPEGAPSAELRSARANSRRQSLRLFNFSLAHQRGGTGFAVPCRRVSAETPEGAPSAELRSARANSRRQSLRLFNSAWHTKGGGTGFAVTRRRVSAETPEGAPSAELRFTRTNSRRQSLRLFNFSLAHQRGGTGKACAPPLVCPPGIEPGTYSVGGCHSIQLRYGHICRPFGLLLL